MAEQDWAPEPLILEEDGGIRCSEEPYHPYLDTSDKATNARIVACYNACAGVSTELLQHIAQNGTLGGLMAELFGDKELFAHLKELGFKQQ